MYTDLQEIESVWGSIGDRVPTLGQTLRRVDTYAKKTRDAKREIERESDRVHVGLLSILNTK